MSISTKLAKQFCEELEALKSEQGGELQIGHIDALFKKIRGVTDEEKLVQGIQDIGGRIHKLKVEISNAHPGKLSDDVIPGANLELEEVVKATEEATNQILDSVEIIQNKVSGLEGGVAAEIQGVIQDEIVKIFEASNFQDITGQRINKVVTTLVDIDASVLELLDALSDKIEIHAVKNDKPAKTAEEDLMNGPQLQDDTPSQDDIDKLFAEL